MSPIQNSTTSIQNTHLPYQLLLIITYYFCFISLITKTTAASQTEIYLPDLPAQPDVHLISKQPLDFPMGVLKATCTCNYSNPVAHIKWYIDKTLINVDGKTSIEVVEKGQKIISTLTTPSLRSMDGRKLSCKAHNARFPNSFVISHEIYLEVLCKLFLFIPMSEM